MDRENLHDGRRHDGPNGWWWWLSRGERIPHRRRHGHGGLSERRQVLRAAAGVRPGAAQLELCLHLQPALPVWQRQQGFLYEEQAQHSHGRDGLSRGTGQRGAQPAGHHRLW